MTKARRFYADILGLEVAMDLGWIVTFASQAQTPPQLSVATEGGSGTPVPDVSIEVDDLHEVERRVRVTGLGPTHASRNVSSYVGCSEQDVRAMLSASCFDCCT